LNRLPFRLCRGASSNFSPREGGQENTRFLTAKSLQKKSGQIGFSCTPFFLSSKLFEKYYITQKIVTLSLFYFATHNFFTRSVGFVYRKIDWKSNVTGETITLTGKHFWKTHIFFHLVQKDQRIFL
jgi:hypothetical protein